jgi:uncharacterized membrane protein YfcA
MEHLYLFPVAILVATFANSSGFSGGVLFQPFFYFFFSIPLKSSIANGIATETLGMSSGALGYLRKGMVSKDLYLKLILWVLAGVLVGLFLFRAIPIFYLKKLVGVSVLLAALVQAYMVITKKRGALQEGRWPELKRFLFIPFLGGAFSATTGTGNAELNQPYLEMKGNLQTQRSNALAIALEATGNVTITLFNLISDNLDWSILMYTLPGVLIGSQLGVWLSSRLNSMIMKSLFAFFVAGIGLHYIFV